MPRLSRLFVRTALAHLVVGFTLGALMLINKGVPLHPLLWRLLPLHVEFLLIGWTVQFIFGVAFWILPRFGTSRGPEGVVWLSYVLLNAGVLLVAAGHLIAGPAWPVLIGRAVEGGAVVAFAFNMWPRIKPFRDVVTGR
ncbi:MAG: hypothetical protein Q9O62_02450 [Ardenticatenia bacterium]|nr:hypothetical protein [Ardenticatenia bacterium]